MKKLKIALNYAGHCFALEKHAIRNGKQRQIIFHALWAFIQHPSEGYILFDTGYTRRFFDATRTYPNKIYAKITKVSVEKEDEIIFQLKNKGITPEEIKHIIISHFHADHVGGLKDFPNAKIHCSKKAYAHTIKLSAFTSFSKGVLKDLLPLDLKERVSFIEETALRKKADIFAYKYDLFGDDSIHIYDLPGHAAGQVGALIETNVSKYFLIADACWLKESYRELVLPHPIVRLFFHSWKEFKSSLKKIHRFHKKKPEVIIVPSHCKVSTDLLVNPKLDLDEI